MVRIFSSLALFSLALIAANLVLGLATGDFHAAFHERLEANQTLRELEQQWPPVEESELREARQRQQEAAERTQRRFQLTTLHRLLGILAALVAVLVNSVTATYFIGTSRWCREVVEAYDLKPELAATSAQLKRRTFPWALIGMLVVVGLVASGGAADPATGHAGTERWVIPHHLAAWFGLFALAWAYYVQVNRIARNYEEIEKIMAEVTRIRSQRGLKD